VICQMQRGLESVLRIQYTTIDADLQAAVPKPVTSVHMHPARFAFFIIPIIIRPSQ